MEFSIQSLGSPAAAPAADPWSALGELTAAIVAVDRVIAQMQASREMLFAVATQLSPALMEDDVVPPGFDAVRWDSRTAELAEHAVAAEIGTATRTSDRTIQRQMAQASDLVARFPVTLKALSEGRISLAHTRVIREAAVDLDDHAAREAYESLVVARAEQETPHRLRRFAAQEAERAHPEPLEDRFERAHGERRVWVAPVRDGMAELTAVLPAAVAHGIHVRLTDMAQAHTEASQRSGGESAELRSMDQFRTDLLADLLLCGAPRAMDDPDGHLAAIKARVDVTIPADALMRHVPDFIGRHGGQGAECSSGLRPVGVAPELNGHHVLDPETARRLAGAETGWNRVLTDPLSGAVLAVDRYRPNADLRRYLSARDSRCRFPGCGIRAAWLDIDHTEDAARGGATTAGNLAGLCRRHHLLKHHSRWSVRQIGRGVLEWRSPAGRVHTDNPPRPATRTIPGALQDNGGRPAGHDRHQPCPDADPPPF